MEQQVLVDERVPGHRSIFLTEELLPAVALSPVRPHLLPFGS